MNLELFLFIMNFNSSDEKQIDFAEQIESVAYVICGENLVSFDKFCLIWNAKGVRKQIILLI